MQTLKVAIATLLLSMGSFNYAAMIKPALDKVSFQTTARLWVSTQTALVHVNIHATLANTNLLQLRTDILANLSKIAKGTWHLTQFERSQDSSGLEKVFVNAEIRVPQSELTDVYKVASSLSKPGASYSIAGIDFTPGLEEITAIKAKVREKLYQQINEELTRLNKAWPDQNYTVNRLYIFDADSPVQPAPATKAKDMKAMMLSATASSSQNLPLSNELTLSAMVELASNRKGSDAVVGH